MKIDVTFRGKQYKYFTQEKLLKRIAWQYNIKVNPSILLIYTQ